MCICPDGRSRVWHIWLSDGTIGMERGKVQNCCVCVVSLAKNRDRLESKGYLGPYAQKYALWPLKSNHSNPFPLFPVLCDVEGPFELQMCNVVIVHEF